MNPTASHRTVETALAFIADHGIVLVAAKGPVPRLIEVIAGEPITGNWWSHPRATYIYNVLAEVQDSDQLLMCRLVNEKITLVHRRLWPALARLASHFNARQIARLVDEHTAKGHHVAHEVPFPDWAPTDVLREASVLAEDEARALLGAWLRTAPSNPKKGSPRRPIR